MNLKIENQNLKTFPPWPCFGDDEIKAVERVLRSGKVNQWTGSEVTNFEEECADFVGVKYAVALTNGSVALELALETLGIGAGDEVIVTCYTFIASAGAVVMRGAVPVMADIDPETLNISADTVRAVISSRTRAIIAVHLGGMPCDMDPLLDLAREYGLKVIEDCAQAHGATYKGQPVGSLGDVAAFSFCQDKIMTTGGEGGMFTTNDRAIWEKAWAYKDHGKSYDSVFHKEHPPGFRWLHDSFGTNWRMTEMQAAIGRVQLCKLPEWTCLRRHNAAMLTASFAGIPALRVLDVPQEFRHAYYKYYVFVRPEKLIQGWNRDRVMNAVTSEGIPCFSGSCSEIYLEKAFVMAGIGQGRRLPVARKMGETSLMFLVHPTLGADEMRDTSQVVEKVMGICTRV